MLNGVPQTFGNTADSTTLSDFLDRIETRYGRADRIWVMDRGVPAEGSLKKIPAMGARYLVGTPKGRLTKLEQDFLAEPWARVRDGVQVSLKAMLRRSSGGLTPAEVIAKFKTIQMVDVHVPTTDGRELVMSRHTQPLPEHRVLLDQLRLTLPEQPPPRITGNPSDHARSASMSWRPINADSHKSTTWGCNKPSVEKVGLTPDPESCAKGHAAIPHTSCRLQTRFKPPPSDLPTHATRTASVVSTHHTDAPHSMTLAASYIFVRLLPLLPCVQLFTFLPGNASPAFHAVARRHLNEHLYQQLNVQEQSKWIKGLCGNSRNRRSNRYLVR